MTLITLSQQLIQLQQKLTDIELNKTIIQHNLLTFIDHSIQQNTYFKFILFSRSHRTFTKLDHIHESNLNTLEGIKIIQRVLTDHKEIKLEN